MNPDFTAAASNIISLLENLRTTRNTLYGLWQNKKQKLDQCFQLKLFEQDAEKVNFFLSFDFHQQFVRKNKIYCVLVQ